MGGWGGWGFGFGIWCFRFWELGLEVWAIDLGIGI